MARVSRVLLFGLATLALAGCSSAQAADLNLKPYVDKPCSMFGADQLSSLGVGRTFPRPTPPNVGVCQLYPKDSNGSNILFHVELDAPAPKGGDQKTVDGYPGYEVGGQGSCTVWVVVGDKQRIMANTKGDGACASAETVATSAIDAIKQQNS